MLLTIISSQSMCGLSVLPCCECRVYSLFNCGHSQHSLYDSDCGSCCLQSCISMPRVLAIRVVTRSARTLVRRTKLETQSRAARTPRRGLSRTCVSRTPTPGNSRRQPLPKQQPREPREYLHCAQCGPVADAHWALTDGGLVQHMVQKHGGQVLLQNSVGQLRWLNRQACAHCSTIRSQRCRGNSCGHLPGQATAGASGRSVQWSGTLAATTSELAAIASRRTVARQPASELHLGRRPAHCSHCSRASLPGFSQTWTCVWLRPRPPTLLGVHAKSHWKHSLVPLVLGLGQPSVRGSLSVKPRWLGPPPSTRVLLLFVRLLSLASCQGV